MWDVIVDVLDDIDSVMYYPILMILMEPSADKKKSDFWKGE